MAAALVPGLTLAEGLQAQTLPRSQGAKEPACALGAWRDVIPPPRDWNPGKLLTEERGLLTIYHRCCHPSTGSTQTAIRAKIQEYQGDKFSQL